MQCGDVILTGVKAKGWVSRLIKFGAWVARYPAAARRFSHVALVIDADTIVEAIGRGVVYSPIGKYRADDCVLIPMGVAEHDQAQIRAFASSVVAAHTAYGYPSFIACGFNCLLAHFKWRPFTFAVAHTKICSALVADALTRAGVIWDKPLEVVMPADIWQQLGHAE